MGGITSIFKKPPKPPSVASQIDAQKQSNQLFQITPQGTLEYGTIGQDGDFVAREGAEGIKVTETPFQEQFREGREDLALGLLGNIDPQNLGEFRTASQIESGLDPVDTDFVEAGDRFEREMFEDTESRLKDSYESRKGDLIQNLADRGIPLSSEAGQEELNRLDEAFDEGLSRASFGALQAGRQEQDRLTRLSSALRGQGFNEQTALTNLEQQQRAQRFGEIGSLAGFASTFNPYQTQGVNAAGIINQNYQQRADRFGQMQKQAGDLLTAGTKFLF
jgi:hypothetical protein